MLCQLNATIIKLDSGDWAWKLKGNILLFFVRYWPSVPLRNKGFAVAFL